MKQVTVIIVMMPGHCKDNAKEASIKGGPINIEATNS